MIETNVFIVCFEIKEDFDKSKIIDYLDKVYSIHDPDRIHLKDCYLVMCKYDEYIFNKHQKGQLGSNDKVRNEINELIQYNVIIFKSFILLNIKGYNNRI